MTNLPSYDQAARAAGVGRGTEDRDLADTRCLDDRVELSRWWPLSDADGLRDLLTAAYSAPGRGYHDLRHLAEVMARLDELAAGGTPFEDLPVRLAAWFHDAVHDARGGDEERSAVWAESALTAFQVPEALVREAARLVRMTEHHRPEPDDPEGCALSDADLAILAAPAERYADYVAGVRREHAHVPSEAFRRGRAALLADLAAKPALFHTAYAREHWEARARVNLQRELAALTTARGTR